MSPGRSAAGRTPPRTRRLIATALLATAAMASAAPATRTWARDDAPPDLARVHYMLHCQGCHLPDGSGSPGKVPPLRGAIATYLTIPDGRAYVVRVPGVSQSPLDDAELAALLNWAVQRFGPAEAAAAVSPYTADEVARSRRPALTDVTGMRSGLRRRLGLE